MTVFICSVCEPMYDVLFMSGFISDAVHPCLVIFVLRMNPRMQSCSKPCMESWVELCMGMPCMSAAMPYAASDL